MLQCSFVLSCAQPSQAYPDGRTGTMAGAYVHWRSGESPCEECSRANVRRVAEWQRRNPAKTNAKGARYARTKLGKESQRRRNHRRRARVKSGNLIPAKPPPFYGNSTCYLCKAEAQELDHVVPLSKGGADHVLNHRPACVSCNRRKGSTMPDIEVVELLHI